MIFDLLNIFSTHHRSTSKMTNQILIIGKKQKLNEWWCDEVGRGREEIWKETSRKTVYSILEALFNVIPNGNERKWKKVMIWKCEKKEIGNEKNILFSSSSFNCSHASCIENKLERCYKYGILMLWHVHTSSLMFLKVIDSRYESYRTTINKEMSKKYVINFLDNVLDRYT